MDWQVLLERDSETGDWAAWRPTLPGCASAGTTREEALRNIREAVAPYLEPEVGQIPTGTEVEWVS